MSSVEKVDPRMFDLARRIAVLLTAMMPYGILLAQNATVSGSVGDASSAVVASAAVTLTHISTGVVQTATTNDAGLYIFPSVSPGQYRLNCSAPGFSSKETSNVTVEVGQSIRFDFQLQIGATTERIEVSASAGLIQTETTEVGQVIDGRRIVDMPLNGRNY